MNNKRWTVVVIALILIVVSGLSAYGLSSQEESMENFLSDLISNEEAEEVVLEEGDASQRVLVMNIEGPIMEGAVASGYDHDALLQAAEQIREDESIKAVLLNLDTPGGSVYLTDELYSLFMEVKEERSIPVYASMGSVAASAGYYYSVMADEIYATPETTTGSIGVILSSFNMEELQDKLGIESVVIKSGKLKDMGSSSRQMTEEEEEILQANIDESYDRFVQAVVDNRPLDEARVRELADGRIYTANQALDHQLIDGILYERDVIEKIKADIGVNQPEFFELAAPTTHFSNPFSLFSTEFIEGLTKTELQKNIETLEELSQLKIEYRWEGY